MVQAHIIFSGTVQGVGFRFTVQRHAQRLGLKGWVKNLPDGTVEILVEGLNETIDEFCQNIEDDFEGYIQDRDIHTKPAESKFAHFQIKY